MVGSGVLPKSIFGIIRLEMEKNQLTDDG